MVFFNRGARGVVDRWQSPCRESASVSIRVASGYALTGAGEGRVAPGNWRKVMKTRHKILVGSALLLMFAVVCLTLVLGYTAPCPEHPVVAAKEGGMRAIVYDCYGDASVLRLESVAKPDPADDEVLVRIVAAAVNPLDWHYMRGSPYFMRLGSGIGAPAVARLGVDFAGIVEAVGKDVTKFAAGDAVFGGRTGAFADYVTIRESRAIAKKPDNVTFAQAAAVPIAGVTALQALRDVGGVQAGNAVLVNGASGGVGTFAVQIAKALGAEVTGVCSERNIELVRSLGADRVIDYRVEDYTTLGDRYRIIVDNVGNHAVGANRHVLTDDGVLVMIGGPKGDWLAPLVRPLQALVMGPFVDQELRPMLAQLDQGDLEYLADLMASGRLAPVIDREFPLEDVAGAMTYSETGRARGKIVIRVAADTLADGPAPSGTISPE